MGKRKHQTNHTRWPYKKPVEELGYKVDEASAEDIRKRKDEWEKGKSVPVVPSSVRNPNDVGYKVDAEGVKDRLQKWNTIGSTKSGTPERKQPVKIPTENATKDDQTDVKTELNFRTIFGLEQF